MCYFYIIYGNWLSYKIDSGFEFNFVYSLVLFSIYSYYILGRSV